jgi:hypothetical protein
MEFMTVVFANAERGCVFVKNEHSAVLCKKSDDIFIDVNAGRF